MVTRRTAFAAPFVMIVGCGRPVDRDLRAPPPLRPTPIDAALASTERDAMAVATTQSVDAARPSLVALPNPPPPDAPEVRPIVARVTKIHVVGSKQIVTLNAGSDKGVSRSSTADFIDDADRPLAGGRCKIIRVNARSTECELASTGTLGWRRVRISL